jgi:hypothetical protein
VKRLSAVTILTHDVDAAAAAWANASGLSAEKSDGEARIAVADVVIRLVGPKEGSHVAGLIDRRGEGMFDLEIEVEGLAEVVEDLRGKGVQVTDPMEGVNGRQEAMIDPASSHGVPIRLVEKQ